MDNSGRAGNEGVTAGVSGAHARERETGLERDQENASGRDS